MSEKTGTVTIRISDEDKKEAKELFSDMGLTLNGAITMFIRQSLNENGLPFKPKALSRETKQALKEFKDGDIKSFNNVDELMEDLNN